MYKHPKKNIKMITRKTGRASYTALLFENYDLKKEWKRIDKNLLSSIISKMGLIGDGNNELRVSYKYVDYKKDGSYIDNTFS